MPLRVHVHVILTHPPVGYSYIYAQASYPFLRRAGTVEVKKKFPISLTVYHLNDRSLLRRLPFLEMNRSAILSFLSPVTFSCFSFCCSAYRFAVFIRDDGHTHTVHERTSMPYLKRRALVHHENGLPLPFIVDALAQEGLSAT